MVAPGNPSMLRDSGGAPCPAALTTVLQAICNGSAPPTSSTMPSAVILPAVTGLFSFMTAWNEFVLAATLMNDARLFTLPVALQRYVGEYQTDWGSFAAGAVIVSVPVMVVFYAVQRHMVGGLTAGAVKG